jgi:DNA-binding NtrC family response regulator
MVDSHADSYPGNEMRSPLVGGVKMHIRWEAVILSTDLEWRRAVAQILIANGMDYACAASIKDCKEIVARESVGMIFWDSHLADGTFQDVLHSMWSLDPRVKIVVISHMDDWDDHLAIARMGAFGVIPFPCQPTDIEWVLSRAVRAEREEAKSDHLRELHFHL